MIVYPLKSRLVKPGDSILEVLVDSLAKNRLKLKTNDIIAVSSKIVAISENSIRNLDAFKVSLEARELGEKFSLAPPFAQVILDEADTIIGGVNGAVLTLKNGDAIPNAGVDRKNAPKNSVVLWPRNSDLAAKTLRRVVKKRLGKNVGVVIVDSRVATLRLGTIGFAIGSSGFHPATDVRGSKDLFGKGLEITFRAIADGVAAAAQLVMGEAAERVPFAIIRDARIRLNRSEGIGQARLNRDHCLYMSQISYDRNASG